MTGNKVLINAGLTACVYKNSSALSNNTATWHYLGTKHLDFRHENNSTPGVLIKEIQYSRKGVALMHFLLQSQLSGR